MFKPIAYFVIGIFTGITISELMKDAKPVNRIDFYDSYRVRYKHPPRYPYGYDYYYRPLEYRSVYEDNLIQETMKSVVVEVLSVVKRILPQDR